MKIAQASETALHSSPGLTAGDLASRGCVLPYVMSLDQFTTALSDYSITQLVGFSFLLVLF